MGTRSKSRWWDGPHWPLALDAVTIPCKLYPRLWRQGFVIWFLLFLYKPDSPTLCPFFFFFELLSTQPINYILTWLSRMRLFITKNPKRCGDSVLYFSFGHCIVFLFVVVVLQYVCFVWNGVGGEESWSASIYPSLPPSLPLFLPPFLSMIFLIVEEKEEFVPIPQCL